MPPKSYPILGRLLRDGILYDPEDPTSPDTIDLDEADAEALVLAGVLAEGVGEAPQSDGDDAGPKGKKPKGS